MMKDLKNKSTFLSMKCKPAPTHCLSSPHSIAPVWPWDRSKNLKKGKMSTVSKIHKKTPSSCPYLRGLHAHGCRTACQRHVNHLKTQTKFK